MTSGLRTHSDFETAEQARERHYRENHQREGRLIERVPVILAAVAVMWGGVLWLAVNRLLLPAALLFIMAGSAAAFIAFTIRVFQAGQEGDRHGAQKNAVPALLWLMVSAGCLWVWIGAGDRL